MTPLLAWPICLGIAGAVLYAAAKLGIFHHLAADADDLWPDGVDEPLDDAVVRVQFDRIIAAERARSRRTHPSMGGEW